MSVRRALFFFSKLDYMGEWRYNKVLRRTRHQKFAGRTWVYRHRNLLYCHQILTLEAVRIFLKEWTGTEIR